MEFRLSAAEVRDENRRRVTAAGMLHTDSWQMFLGVLALLSCELIRDQLVRSDNHADDVDTVLGTGKSHD